MHLISRNNLPTLSSLQLHFNQLKETLINNSYFQQMAPFSTGDASRAFYEKAEKVKVILLSEKTMKIARYLVLFCGGAAIFGILYLIKTTNALLKENKNLSEITKELEKIKNQLVDKEKEIVTIQTQITTNTKEFENSKENLVKQVGALKVAYQSLLENIQIKESDLLAKEQKCAQKNIEYTELEANYQTLLSKIQNLETNLAETNKKTENLQNHFRRPEPLPLPPQSLDVGGFELIEESNKSVMSDPLAASVIEAYEANKENRGIVAHLFQGAFNIVANAKQTVTTAGLATLREAGARYAFECFTTNAPEYKILQVSHMLINLQVEMSKALGFNFEVKGDNKNLDSQIDAYNKTIVGEGCETIRELLKDLFQIKNNNLKIEDAPKIRYQFLMKLESCTYLTALNLYEKDILVYHSQSSEERIKNYPKIHLLHLIAKHLTETPIWNHATKRLDTIFKYQNIDVNRPVNELLRSDTAQMKSFETAVFEKGTNWEKWGLNCEKARMMVPGSGTREATNYRSNYSSLLGTLTINETSLNWLAMGAPSIDGGLSSEPAALSVLYKLYLDYLKTEGKSLNFFGLQKCPNDNYSDFESDDYEKNRTAAFMEATKNPRWKNTFSFGNLSLDQVIENKTLNLRGVKSLEKNGNSETVVLIGTFSEELKRVMVNNEYGFWGLNQTDVEEVIPMVKNAFFPNHTALNDKERWTFLMLTYAMIVLESSKKNKRDFHFNCKDHIDRGAVLATTVKWVTSFALLSSRKLAKEKRKDLINEIRTMFSHRAHYVKGQAVIESRAPLAYFVSEHLEKLIEDGVSAEQLSALPKFSFTPYLKVM